MCKLMKPILSSLLQIRKAQERGIDVVAVEMVELIDRIHYVSNMYTLYRHYVQGSLYNSQNVLRSQIMVTHVQTPLSVLLPP